MATNGAVKNYKFGTKNNWRRQLWNHIVALLKEMHVKPGDAKVLYLAGRDDLDRVEAKRRGFKDWNLFAVENDVRTLRALRDKGVIAIHGDFSEVLYCWPQHLDVVIADFCCGYHHRIMDRFLEATIGSQATPRSVLAINMLRGRDSDFTEMKDWYKKGTLREVVNCYTDYTSTFDPRLSDIEFFLQVKNDIDRASMSRPVVLMARIWGFLVRRGVFEKKHADRMYALCNNNSLELSYRSNCGQVFDTWIGPYLPRNEKGQVGYFRFEHGPLATSDLTRTRRRISAALAQSTSWQRYGNKAGKTA